MFSNVYCNLGIKINLKQFAKKTLKAQVFLKVLTLKYVLT